MSYADDYNALSSAVRAGLDAYAQINGHPVCAQCLDGASCLECPNCIEHRAAQEADEDRTFLDRVMGSGEEPPPEQQEAIIAAMHRMRAEAAAIAVTAERQLAAAYREPGLDPVERARVAFAWFHIRDLAFEADEGEGEDGAVGASAAPAGAAVPEGSTPVEAARLQDPVKIELSRVAVDTLPIDDPVWALWLHHTPEPWMFARSLSFYRYESDDDLWVLDRRLAGSSDPFVSSMAKVSEAIVGITRADSTATDEDREKAEDLIREVFADDEGMCEAALAALSMRPLTMDDLVPVGAPAPPFELPTADGTEVVSLAAHAGHPVLLQFTGSWCGPCKFELPYVREIHEAWADRGVDVVWVALEQSAEDLRDYLADNAVPWDVGLKLGGPDGVMADYGAFGVPVFYVIDANGVVMANDLRPSSHRADIDALLAEALEKAPASGR